MIGMRNFLFFFLSLLSLLRLTFSFYSFPLMDPSSCEETEYFNSIRLICAQCDQKDSQMRSEDGMSCICKANHRLIFQNGDIIKCEPCPINQVTSLNGWNCSVCGAENPFDNSTNQCSRCQNGIKAERLNEQNITEQYCSPCLGYTWPDSTGLRCIYCPQEFHDILKGKCDCPDQHLVVGGTCVAKLDLVPSNPSQTTVKYDNGLSIPSSFFMQHFQAVVYNCKTGKNSTACQTLANMCVLLMYNMDKFHSGGSDACSEYLTYTYRETTVHLNQWPQHSPWIYYYKTDAKTELSKLNVPLEFSPNPTFGPNKLHFIAAKYNLEGNFLGYESITKNILKICGIGENDQDSVTFGTTLQVNCKMRVQDLWSNAKLFFYEILLSANESLKHNLIYPVPVRILNQKSEGSLINRDSDMSKWQLVRRFFLYDPISGIENGQLHNSQQRIAKVFRYASHLSLDIKAQKEGKTGAIYPPLITIEYAELTLDDYYKNEQIPVTFLITYSMDQTKIFEDISIAIGVLSGLSILWSAIQTWGWSKRSGREVIDLAALGKLLIFSCGNLSSIFFMVMVASALNWMILFKRQDVFHLFLPTSNQENKIKVYLILAFVMKTLQIIHILAIQCMIDIFFIDWEKSRGQSSAANILSPKSKEIASGECSAVPVTKKNKLNIDRRPDSNTVSIWRTYFLANEWCEIQCMRRVKLSFHLLAVLFFLKGIGFENLARSDPITSLSSETEYANVPYSFTCRFAVASCAYIVLCAVQILICKIIQERFFQDKLQDFVDLCSVSNISVFIMSARRFGYYIHGRSTHGRADVNMKEMHELLRREEEDLCGHRGLLPNTEQQTFQMSLPSLVRDQYEHSLLPLNSYSQAADRMQGAGGRLSKVDIDKVANIYHTVNKFLSGFIEHVFKDLDYVIKDKLFLENLLDVEFAETGDRGCFYNDNGHSFDNVLLCGQELPIILFELMLFIIVDMIFYDFVIAAVVTFIIGKIIESLRRSIGRRNLVKKALIDERFLS